MTRSILDSSLPSLGEASRLAAMGRGIRVLRSEDFEVHMVAEGSKVAEAVRDFKPHVVVLDIGMPGRNGYDVASDLRREHGERCPTLRAPIAAASSTTLASRTTPCA